MPPKHFYGRLYPPHRASCLPPSHPQLVAPTAHEVNPVNKHRKVLVNWTTRHLVWGGKAHSDSSSQRSRRTACATYSIAVGEDLEQNALMNEVHGGEEGQDRQEDGPDKGCHCYAGSL